MARKLPPCPSGIFFEVGPGDTFFTIAARSGISAAEIQAANPGLDPRNLQIGTVLCIPRRAAAPGVPRPPGVRPACPNGTLVTVRPGDTFFLIAQRFGISTQQLIAANPGFDPRNLPIGTILCVPRAAAPAPRPPGPPPGKFPPCPTGLFFEVAPGDTIFLIARQLGVTVEAILRLNPQVDPTNLQIGTILCLPRRN